MTICFAQLGATVRQSVTTSPASWTDPAHPTITTGYALAWRGSYFVSSDQPFHIDTHATADPDTSPRIPSDTIVEVELKLGESISFVLAESASSGSIWITKKA